MPTSWLGDDAFLRLIRYNAGTGDRSCWLPGSACRPARSWPRPSSKNITEFLAEAGYDVWLFDYRAGIDLPSARHRVHDR